MYFSFSIKISPIVSLMQCSGLKIQTANKLSVLTESSGTAEEEVIGLICLGLQMKWMMYEFYHLIAEQ